MNKLIITATGGGTPVVVFQKEIKNLNPKLWFRYCKNKVDKLMSTNPSLNIVGHFGFLVLENSGTMSCSTGEQFGGFFASSSEAKEYITSSEIEVNNNPNYGVWYEASILDADAQLIHYMEEDERL